MKAWLLENRNDPDQGGWIVFANTRNEARKQADRNDMMYDSWLDVTARRAKNYDDMEKLSAAELALQTWRDGWRWFDYEAPDPDTTTDKEFLEWYTDTFQ